MKKAVLAAIALAGMVALNGCSGKAPEPAAVKTPQKVLNLNVKGEVALTDPKGEALGKDARLIKAKAKAYGKKGAYMALVPAVDTLIAETKKRGYRYFQIIHPTQISNLNGFPICTKDDLVAFVQPAIDMPRDQLNLFETGKTLMDNQKGQDVVDVPFTIFGDTEVELVARLVEKPAYDEIVWDVEGH